jgi:hypothetical protein
MNAHERSRVSPPRCARASSFEVSGVDAELRVGECSGGCTFGSLPVRSATGTFGGSGHVARPSWPLKRGCRSPVTTRKDTGPVTRTSTSAAGTFSTRYLGTTTASTYLSRSSRRRGNFRERLCAITARRRSHSRPGEVRDENTHCISCRRLAPDCRQTPDEVFDYGAVRESRGELGESKRDRHAHTKREREREE